MVVAEMVIDEYLVNHCTGQIDYPTVNSLLSSLWTKLNALDLPVKTVKKVYSVATECLENIYKYADSTSKGSIIFEIIRHENSIEIYAQNLLKKVKVAKLEYNIDLVNSLNKIELKKLFKHKIQTRKISELGGAGLGLIIIARKIEGKIDYSITDITDTLSQYTFRASVSIDAPSV